MHPAARVTLVVLGILLIYAGIRMIDVMIFHGVLMLVCGVAIIVVGSIGAQPDD